MDITAKIKREQELINRLMLETETMDIETKLIYDIIILTHQSVIYQLQKDENNSTMCAEKAQWLYNRYIKGSGYERAFQWFVKQCRID